MKPTLPLTRVLAVSATLLAFVAGGLAQPAYVNYQGRLSDAAGQPLSTGTYTLEFSIYDDATGSAPTNRVWGPFLLDGAVGDGHGPSVGVIDGRFNAILGPVDTGARSIQDAFDGDSRYLEIKVNNGAPILPRQQFLSTPFAFRARSVAGNLAVPGDLSVQGGLTVGSGASILGEARSTLNGQDFFMVPRGSIVMWSGSVTNLPTGWALCDGQNGTPDLRDRFVLGFNPDAPEPIMGEAGGAASHDHSVDIGQFNTGSTGGNLGWAGIRSDWSIPGAHTHTVNPPATPTTTASHLPPFIRLGFIMRL